MQFKINKLIIFFIIIISFSFSEKCNVTADCVEGYCDNGFCVTPMVSKNIIASCKVTADCVEGYCEKEKCVLPTEEQLSQLLWLRSGCAGVFNCPETNFVCLIICNMIWLILIILSAVAGYSARTYENKLIPFIYFVLPLGIGVFSIPIAGIIITILELFSIHYEKTGPISEKIEEFFYTFYLPEKKKR